MQINVLSYLWGAIKLPKHWCFFLKIFNFMLKPSDNMQVLCGYARYVWRLCWGPETARDKPLRIIKKKEKLHHHTKRCTKKRQKQKTVFHLQTDSLASNMTFSDSGKGLEFSCFGNQTYDPSVTRHSLRLSSMSRILLSENTRYQ